MHLKTLISLLFIFTCYASIAQSPCQLPGDVSMRTVFVKDTGSGSKNGSSWDNALDGRLLAKYLRDIATDSTVLYVAQGVYYPYLPGCDDSTTYRTYSFSIYSNLTMKGGYPNTLTGTDTSIRDMKQFATRLSGEIQQDSNSINNSFHVVYIALNISATIEGFYISDGYADNGASYPEGTPQVGVTDGTNGGGILDAGGTQSIVHLKNLVIENNAADYGAGIYFKSNSITIIENTIIRNNRGLINYGGAGIFAWGNFRLLNSTICNNINGDGITSWGGDMQIWNSTISGNDRSGIYLTPSTEMVLIGVVSSTIANNKKEGLKMNNTTTDPSNMQLLNLENSLIINNNNSTQESGNLNISGTVVATVLRKIYSIIGDQFYDGQEPIGQNTTLPVLVSIGPLADNNSFTPTHALLKTCNNPAVNTGSPGILDKLNDTLHFDQRGVPRDTPNPCIGAFDGITETQLLTHPDSVTGCVRSSISMGVTAIPSTGSSITAYQWQKNGVDIPGATDSTLSFTSLQLSDSAYYSATVTTDSACTAVSDSIHLMTRSLPTAIVSGDTSICTGTTANLHFTLTGTAPWTVFYTDGTTNFIDSNIQVADHSITVSPAGSTTYTLTSVNDAYCSNSSSSTVTVNVTGHASLQTAISNAAPCVNSNISMSVTATPSAGSVISAYQWRKNGIDIPGATGSAYSINSIQLNDSGNYAVIAFSDLVCPDTSTIIPVVTRPLPTAIISGDTSICAGSAANLYFTFTGTAPWTVTYTDGVNNFTNSNILTADYSITVSPASSITYTITSINDAYCTNSSSSTTTVNVTGHASLQTTISNGAPCVNSNISMSVTATPSTGAVISAYQWRKNGIDIPGAISNIYSINSVQLSDSGNYAVVAFSDLVCPDTSTIIPVVTRPLPTAIISGDTSICAGSAANLYFTFTGTAPWTVTYTDGVNNFTNSNILTNDYSIAVSPAGSTTYTITSVNDSYCTNSSSSTTTVNVTGHASLQTTISNAAPCVNSNISMSVTPTPSAGSVISAYQWRKNGTDIPGATDSVYSISSVQLNDSGNYAVIAFSDLVCPDTSTIIPVVTRPLPTAIISGDTSICTGTTANLYFTFTGTAPWTVTYTDGVNNFTNSNILTANYSIAVSPVSSTVYTITAVNDAYCTNSSSSTTTVNVTGHASLQTTISNATPCVNANISMSVTATPSTGAVISAYQWRKNGVDIPGATGSTYPINSVQLSDSGNYAVVAFSDLVCPDTSAIIPVITRPLPTAVISGDTSICAGTAANLYFTFTGTAPWTVTYTDGVNNFTNSNILTANYSIAVSPAGSTTYTITSVNDAYCTNSSSSTTTVNVTGHASLQTTISNGAPCINSDISMSVTATPSTGAVISAYQWRKNGVDIPGATGSTYPINSVQLSDSGNYAVVAFSDLVCPDTSTIIPVVTRPLPTAVISGDTSICAGSAANLYFTFTGTAPWTVTYTDGVNNFTNSNILTNDYSIAVSPASSTVYTITAVNDAYCFNNTNTSNATITILPRPVATATPDSLSIASGSTVNIQLSSSPLGASFVWSRRIVSGVVSGASPGTGNVISQTLAGNGLVRYTILPSLSGCQGDTIVVPVLVSGSNADLASLSVNNVPVSNFNPSITQYADTVGYAINTANITGIPADSNATVANITNAPLNMGDNHFTLTVTAADGFDHKDYLINVVRLGNNDTLQGLTVNGRQVLITAGSNTINVQMQCGENMADIVATPPVNGSVTVNGVPDSLTLSLPAPGIYTVSIVVTAQDNSYSQTYTLNIGRPFDGSVLFQPYNTMLEVISNPANNGGYEFVKHQWYKNGTAIPGETKAYLYEQAGLDSSALYSVELTTSTGITAFTCPKKITLKSGLNIKIFPNPVHPGEDITIQITRDVNQDANIDINLIDVNGRVVFTKKGASDKTVFRIPQLPAGVYILQLHSPFLGDKSFNIIIL